MSISSRKLQDTAALFHCLQQMEREREGDEFFPLSKLDSVCLFLYYVPPQIFLSTSTLSLISCHYEKTGRESVKAFFSLMISWSKNFFSVQFSSHFMKRFLENHHLGHTSTVFLKILGLKLLESFSDTSTETEELIHFSQKVWHMCSISRIYWTFRQTSYEKSSEK